MNFLKVAIKEIDNINATPIISFIDLKIALTKIYKKNVKNAVKNILYPRIIKLVQSVYIAIFE